ncbi:MAG TPA: serine/threonine-protein kinase [Pilimelia sp.]|nr:serine/threonine-protein kinase [Pilimelia sp.]
MTSDHASRARPLRPSDPQRLGSYEVTARLGEGGMGTVYLATTPAGAPVALKVIRTDLAHDPEFRRRFRSEVERARQVPPFCTAEVLDADPDHDPPYLVVEYVDGPSLAAMVEERGPLTPANLHGLAIGVATALTAIHGAGVIHRDLKPTNVLLPPGSPKVIDFGIARPVHDASGSTVNGQLIGTIAYMAPERFGQAGSADLTPAADIFAWGAVVAYAGTGHTPYRADSPEIVAVQILTQPPDLAGLGGPLRDLVASSLAKDPAERPTARDLLDGLLTAGSQGSRDLAVALARQPALLRAAEEAQAVTDHRPAAELATAGPAATEAAAPATEAAAPALAEPTVAVGGGAPAAGVTAPVWVPSAPDETDALDGPAERSTRGRRTRVLAGLLALAAVLAAGAVGGAAAGILPVPWEGGQDPPAIAATSEPPPSEATPTPVPSGTLVPPGATIVMADELTSENLWEDRTDANHKVKCTFDRALVVTKESGGTYRCPGPRTALTDFSLSVDVSLLTPGSCAGIWFRFLPFAGYALEVCRDAFHLVTHGAGGTSDVVRLNEFPLASPIPLDTPIRVGISAQGTDLLFFRGEEQVGAWQDSTFTEGRVVLGIFGQGGPNQPPPYSVSFADIKVWRAGA